ncbi:TRAP transporter large permease [Ramlibacter tataouinensis]|uniref:TRAP transporter large permease n=1 Tax=Ramlibacter tataouinensis TaxID=94132 RepID=UPI0022F3C0BC|nr:TRAP transporter large permease [Ramlibacter tataouinensis]WBY00252.1 TRAP transporter large permease [Ramlibacter tataouinensis]
MNIALAGFAAVFLLAFFGVPLGIATLLVGVGGFALLRGLDPALEMLAQMIMDSSANYGMSVLPMFVLMGVFVQKADIVDELYAAANAWVGHLRGGLAQATVLSCALFAAISGSSIATAATMSKVSIKPMRGLGYDDRLSTGTVASAGVLGVLIPPSVPLVVFGLLTETDIRKLFIASVVPGLLLAALFFLTVWISVRRNPALGPAGPKQPTAVRLKSLKGVWPVLALFTLIMGGLYGGIFTATESAGIGAAGAFLFGAARRRITLQVFIASLVEAGKTTAMIFTIIFGALVFTNLITLSGLTGQLVAWIQGGSMSATGVILSIGLIYLVMGCFMEGMGLMLLTAPLFAAIASQVGIDLVWLGVFVVMMIEIGMLTPPVGMNLFTVKAMCPEVPLSTIVRGAMPFVVANLVAVVLVCVWPTLALTPVSWF